MSSISHLISSESFILFFVLVAVNSPNLSIYVLGTPQIINYTVASIQKEVHNVHFLNFLSKISSDPFDNQSITNERKVFKYNETDHNSELQTTVLQHKANGATKSHWKKERFQMIKDR
ncbi:hypothetical protein MS3_00000547 [Schistosoma haematobium]|uniref:Uncharacterized protein n=1 Tax=Schistosoma haematobium TaxID=6185 RepID=A0A922IJG8_SCHHA|nr:hypothetical protein MS3_00000547 [Schistosoma haematobium]KAH9580983.1 hypothetical protein MS3_00000547 [Schistosoma haematobium]CAH8627601.1 unnamed protein product [Schistosoma haematobium]